MASNVDTTDNDNQSFNLSIWLVPSPKEPARNTLANLIVEYSKRETASAPFPPHITLVGGIHCPSLDFFHSIFLPRLQEYIAAAGVGRGVSCQFREQPVVTAAWNQACVLVMEESDQFNHLVNLCRTVVAEVLPPVVQPGEQEKVHGYPPPLRKPHLSLYYGTDEFAPRPEEIKQQVGPSLSFLGDRLVIWLTDPSTAKGVALWTELAVIDL